MQTRAALVEKTANFLGITAVGQTLDADTGAIIDANLPIALKTFAARELVYVPDIENIPDEIFLQLAVMCAGAVKHTFGLQTDELDRLEQSVLKAEYEIREIVRGKPTYEALRIAYY